MCYDIRYLTQREVKYAERFGLSVSDIEDLRKKIPPTFHTTGFAHADIPVITNRDPKKLQLFSWGLIPFWVKDVKSAQQLANKTLNARAETVFDKPSFRAAAQKRRCLVVVDGFFEHHHANQQTYPFHIKLKNDDPFALAGIWEQWHLEKEGITRNTVSIITTQANALLARIHNNPKLKEPRMPVIMPPELCATWLQPVNDRLDVQELKELLQPYDAEAMEAYPVAPIRGKHAVGNTAEAIKPHPYSKLELTIS